MARLIILAGFHGDRHPGSLLGHLSGIPSLEEWQQEFGPWLFHLPFPLRPVCLFYCLLVFQIKLSDLNRTRPGYRRFTVLWASDWASDVLPRDTVIGPLQVSWEGGQADEGRVIAERRSGVTATDWRPLYGYRYAGTGSECRARGRPSWGLCGPRGPQPAALTEFFDSRGPRGVQVTWETSKTEWEPDTQHLGWGASGTFHAAHRGGFVWPKGCRRLQDGKDP